jgi:hypothetical protein
MLCWATNQYGTQPKYDSDDGSNHRSSAFCAKFKGLKPDWGSTQQSINQNHGWRGSSGSHFETAVIYHPNGSLKKASA